MPENETIATDNTQRDAEVVAFKPNFDLLSTDATLNGNVEAPKEEVKEEVKLENKPEEVVESEIKLDEEKPTEVKEEVKEVLKEETPVEDVLTLDDENVVENPEGWIAYAKSEGLDITEDTPEAYIAAKIEPLQKQLAEVDNKKMEDYFHNLDPKTRMEIELQQTGMTLKEINAPLESIAKYRSLTPVELYREDLTATIEDIRELTESDRAWIDSEIEKKVETGEIEHEAKKVLLKIDAAEKEILSSREQIIEKYKTNKDNYIVQKSKEQNESIIKSLNEIKDFMGSPLAPETVKGLTERFNNGKYDQVFNDPTMRAKFIAFVELGEKAVKNIEAKSYNKGKLEIANKLHNTPPKTNGGAGTEMTNTIEGNFERLAADFKG
jgi:hypothetical protein